MPPTVEHAARVPSFAPESLRPVGPACALRVVGKLAADALRDEAWLTPKPGLVDDRGSGAHDDMDLALLLRSADVLEPWLTQAAQLAQTAAREPHAELRLRRDLGQLGRQAEAEMLAATGGVNTHRGALFTLGFLVAGAGYAAVASPTAVTKAAAELASLPDIATSRVPSHGDRVREGRPGVGAAREAAAGFPVVLQVALPALRAARRRGIDERVARLDALLAVMAVLDDTCVLYRGGGAGLELVRRGAARVLDTGGVRSAEGRRRLSWLDERCRARRLSPGGAGDVLAAAMFLDRLDRHAECVFGGADADPEL
jgi:triphosphoribosyl-dephospho-CoA synthase